MNKERYDAVVIGSGMGGICAAAFLTGAGYKTLLTEKLPWLGGRCSSIPYKGFELTTGAMSISGQGSAVAEAFSSVGAELDICAHPESTYRVKGKDIQLPGKGGLRSLLAAAGESTEDADRIMNAIRKAWTWLEPSAMISIQDWLLQYTQNENILGVFGAIVGSQHSVRLNELPAPEFIHFLQGMSSVESYGFAPKGNRVFMESLAEAIRQKGADVWTHSPVKRITLTNGTASGVVVQKEGKDIAIDAKVVISNAGPRKTVELAGEMNFDRGYLKELKEKVRPAPFIWLAMSADEPLIGDQACLMLTDSRRVNSIWCPTTVCPDLAPPGKHLIYAGCNPPSSLPPMNRQEDIELSIQDLRNNLPGFDDKTEMLLASYFCGDWPTYHTWPGYDLSTKTSIENLYNVGDGVKPSGQLGLPGCAQTAKQVVEDIKKRINVG